jgi:probable rRNA maturation factor
MVQGFTRVFYAALPANPTSKHGCMKEMGGAGGNCGAIEITRRGRIGARGGSIRLIRSAAEAVLNHEQASGRTLSILLTDDREIHELNLSYAGQDKPTDVLAFALDEVPGGALDGALGDVILSVERAQAQADKRNIGLDAELELLVVHGILHLLGYDHDTPEKKRVMWARTRAIRRLL